MSKQLSQFYKKYISKQLGGGLIPENLLSMLDNSDNIIIGLLVIYISMVSMYTPRSIINLVNQPLIKIVVLGIILYTATYNMVLAIFISIALIITVSIDNSIIASKTLLPIREKFTDKSSDSEDTEEEGFAPGDEEDDGENNENFTDGEHETSENFDEQEDFEDSEEFEANLSSNKNLNDTFKNLHDAIHKLETFISEKKK